MPRQTENAKVIVGTRRVMRMRGSLMITLPAELCHRHGISEGDGLPFAANHIMKLIPVPEERQDLPRDRNRE